MLFNQNFHTYYCKKTAFKCIDFPQILKVIRYFWDILYTIFIYYRTSFIGFVNKVPQYINYSYPAWSCLCQNYYYN